MDNNIDKYIGKILDNRYEIIEKIGVGGMALVYKALCHRLNRYVAVKILKDELAVDDDFRQRFHTESQAVAMLSHSNIVTVYDVSRSSEIEYIVMELIEGITLKQYMQKRGVLSWKESLHFSTQITKALSHAHSRGIIHRDIKPHNIMVLKDSSVKVADFGIAHLQSTQNTLTQETLGSVHYISPEQAKGSHVDARTDIYSLGVVMYEMLTGRLPFEGDSAVSVAIQHISSIPLMPREINEEIPQGFETIVMRAMNPDLKHRYQSADELFDDLEEFRKNPETDFDYSEYAFVAPGLVDESEYDYVPEVEHTSDKFNRTGTGIVPPVSRRGEMDKEDYSRSSRRARRVSSLTGLFCVIVFLIGAAFFLWNTFLKDTVSGGSTDDELEVPSWVGSHYQNVIDNPSFTKYYNFIQVEVPSEDVKEGYIISQNPTEGRKVKKREEGVTITLTISSGKETILMPAIVNQEYRQAVIDLQKQIKLDIRDEVVTSDSVTEGFIIKTEPVAGEALHPGDIVFITVSGGPEIKMTKVPELLGKNYNTAVSMLEGANLTPNALFVDDEAEKGTVIYQSISPYTEVAEHTKINFTVSNGPVETPSPSPTQTEQQESPTPSNIETENPTDTPETEVTSDPAESPENTIGPPSVTDNG